jgi:hypothetical protein
VGPSGRRQQLTCRRWQRRSLAVVDGVRAAKMDGLAEEAVIILKFLMSEEPAPCPQPRNRSIRRRRSAVPRLLFPGLPKQGRDTRNRPTNAIRPEPERDRADCFSASVAAVGVGRSDQRECPRPVEAHPLRNRLRTA